MQISPLFIQAHPHTTKTRKKVPFTSILQKLLQVCGYSRELWGQVINSFYFAYSQQKQQQLMSSEGKIKKMRVLSAKITSQPADRVRPLSGVSTQTYARKELIETVYNGQAVAQINRAASAKTLTTRFASATMEGEKAMRKVVVKSSKKKEEMAEEIMNLKQTVNKLVEELSQQKGKTESMRKKNKKFSKILDIEFENEQHWNSAATQNHLVSGIRNMYDTLKEKYDTLLENYDALSKREAFTREAQLALYAEILEKENKALNIRIEKMANNNFLTGTTDQKKASEYIMNEVEAQRNNLAEKYKELSAKYKMSNENLKDRNKKILFLQKLIIEKDNNIHAALRSAKQAQQENGMLKIELKSVQRELEELQEKYSREADLNKQHQYDIQSAHAQELKQVHKNKDSKIQSLEKENLYLQNMIKELRATNSEINRVNQQLKDKKSKEIHAPVYNFEKRQEIDSYSSSNKRQINFIAEHEKTVSEYTSRKSNINIGGKRIPQKADKKHHERSQKKRKVDYHEIVDIAELVRLRLIEANVSQEKLKLLFDHTTTEREDPKDRQWHEEYITMQEVRLVLQSRPISLSADDAHLLARYLIEDVQEEYVYCDDLNENHREVVKSIVKTLVQAYPLRSDNPKLNKQYKQTLEKYGVNFHTTLKSIEPSGKISKKKFLQTLRVLGIDCLDEVKDLLLAKIAVQAPNIHSLPYDLLF